MTSSLHCVCRLRRSVSDRVKVRMRSRDSPRSVDDDGLKGDKEGEDTGTTDGKGLTSEPINVRGSVCPQHTSCI